MFLSQKWCRSSLLAKWKCYQKLMCCCLKCYYPVRGEGWGCFSSTLLHLQAALAPCLTQMNVTKQKIPTEMLWLPHRPCSPSDVVLSPVAPLAEEERALFALFAGVWPRAPSMEGLHLPGSKARQRNFQHVSQAPLTHTGWLQTLYFILSSPRPTTVDLPDDVTEPPF